MDHSELNKMLSREGLSAPDTLTIALTAECNLSCTHCWVDAEPSRSAAQLPAPIFDCLLNDLLCLGGTGIRLTGGEPLLHPDWRRFMSRAAESPLEKIILQTNGLLFREEDLKFLRQISSDRLLIQISLDGAKSGSHDLVRGAGTFQQTLDELKKLVEKGLGPQVAIFFTEMSHNLEELPEVFALAADLGVSSVSSGTLVGCGRAGVTDLIAPPRPEQYLDLLRRYETNQTFRDLYRKIGCIATLEWCYSESSAGRGCAFIKTPYLTSSGTLYPCLMCHSDEFAVQSVYDKGLLAAIREGAPLWSELQQLSHARADKIAACQECRLAASCGAGCMGRAWGSFGDFLAADDRCRQRQAVMGWLEKG